MSTITTPSPIGLTHQPGTRLVFGPGSLSHLPSLASEFNASRIMIISDPGVTAAGHTQRAHDLLAEHRLAATTFTGVHENPTTVDVDAAVQVANAFKPDLLVGLGGGSALDTAKGCNFIVTHGGVMADYHHRDEPLGAMLPMIAVPTTHGTGSEAQSYALIADAATHMKMACGDPQALPKIALLDPELTLTQPAGVAACTAIDALTHAVESYVSNNRTDVSMRYAAEAFKRVYHALPRMIADPTDLGPRGDLLLGAAYAGLAIENSMLGSAHSAANPLTAAYNTVHGQAVGVMLPSVIRFNLHDPAAHKAYAELAGMAGLDAAQAFPDAIASRVREAGLQTDLASLGVERDMIPRLAEQAAPQWTARFNPRAMTADDFAAVYQNAYEGT